MSSSRILTIGFLVFILSLLSQEKITAQDAIDLPADLQEVLDNYSKYWEAKDASQLAALFTEDGQILRPGHTRTTGRSEIEEAYKNSGGPLYLRAYDYQIQGTLAYIIGGYASSSDTKDVGKFTLILKQEDGKWMIHSDMDNHNGQ